MKVIYITKCETPSKLVNFCTDQLGQFCQSASWDCTLNINAGRNYNTVLTMLPTQAVKYDSRGQLNGRRMLIALFHDSLRTF